VQALRQEAAGKYTYQFDSNYQQVYRTIVDRARACWQTGMITAQMVVQGDLYTDIRSGTISVALHGGFGVDTYLAIDIVAIGDARTVVHAYYAAQSWEPGARAVKAWVTGTSQECRASSVA
jgi:hypothetical protein